MRVLLIEENTATANAVETMLKSEGYDCDCTEMGDAGLEIDTLDAYDLILLDLASSDMDGYEVFRRLLAALVRTPILILSSLPRPDKKLRGLGVSAYNYLAKPFDRDALLAHMQTLLLRPRGPSDQVIQTGMLSVDVNARAAAVTGQPLHLTDKEYEILELLMLHKGTAVTKEMILNHLYGGVDEPDLRIIDVFVCKLRKKIAGLSGDETYIDTIWGRGYVLRDIVVASRKKENRAQTQLTAA